MQVEEFVNVILRRASNGVYRSELLLVAGALTHKQIAEAIRLAKKKGLYSIPDMRRQARDVSGGDTYYQYDGETR